MEDSSLQGNMIEEGKGKFKRSAGWFSVVKVYVIMQK